MNSNVKKLRDMYMPDHRHQNFGDVIIDMKLHGVRGVDASLSFDFPITIIAGKNGSGKSTVAQLCLCGYRFRGNESDPYNTKDYFSLGNFFIKSGLDASPYSDDAYIEYTYAADKSIARRFTQLSLFADGTESDIPSFTNTIRKTKSEWGGYRRRPNKRCVYFGMGFFVPHHEMGDAIYLDVNTRVEKSKAFSAKTRELVENILGNPYSQVAINTIVNKSKVAEIGFATKYGAMYSENHMGCGEGRLIRMVNALESANDRTLFVIEEPETALHQNAQHNFAQYLLDVVCRKKHQIIVTSHSADISAVMPLEARKVIIRDNLGIHVDENPTISKIVSEMSDGHQKTLLVYVEDEFAQKYLTEILRKFNRDLLICTSVVYVGNKDDVRNAVRYTSKHSHVKVIGIRDELHTQDMTAGLLAFPHSVAPEVEIFTNADVVTYLDAQYSISTSSICKSNVNHHEWVEKIAREAYSDENSIKTQAIQKYLEKQSTDIYKDLLKQLIDTSN